MKNLQAQLCWHSCTLVTMSYAKAASQCLRFGLLLLLSLCTFFLHHNVCAAIVPSALSFDCATLAPISASTDADQCYASGVNISIPEAMDESGNIVPAIGTRSDNLTLNSNFEVGVTTITWTFTDPTGNMVACDQIVEVTDGENPTISCGPSLVVTAETCNGVIVDIAEPEVTDNCTIVTLSYIVFGATSGIDIETEPFAIGRTFVRWTATDGNGNTRTCTQQVEVLPCPGLQPLEVDADIGQCFASNVAIVAPNSANGCAVGDTVTGIREDGADLDDDYPMGDNIITWTFIDQEGNTQSCDQIIEVEPPYLCPPNQEVNAETCEGTMVNIVWPAIDNCSQVSFAYIVVGATSGIDIQTEPFSIGVTFVIWTATDNSTGRTSSCIQNIEVLGFEELEFDCTAIQTLQVATDAGQCTASNVNIVTPNACGGVETITGIRDDGLALEDDYPPGNTIITWTATDATGNSIDCEQTVTVTDNEAPMVLTCSEDIYTCDPQVSWENPTFWDNCGAQLSSVVPVSGSSFTPGETEVVITISDLQGNESYCTFSVFYQPFEVTIETAGSNGFGVDCAGGNTAWLEAVVDSDYEDDSVFNYSWNTGETTASIIDLAAGVYVVQVTNPAGCTVQAQTIVSAPQSMTVSADIVDVLCPEGSNLDNGADTGGRIDLSVNGGVAPYAYSWTGPAGFVDPGTASIFGLTEGLYTYTVTDANGCTYIDQATVDIPVPLAMIGNSANTSEGNSGNASPVYYNTHVLEFSGGTGPYDYDVDRTGYVRWDIEQTEDGETVTVIYADNAEWVITVYDSNGCSRDLVDVSNDSGNGGGNVSVSSQGNILDIDDVTITGQSDQDFPNGSIEIEVVGGTLPYSFTWYGPGSYQMGPSPNLELIDELESGFYEVEVTDSSDEPQSSWGYYWVSLDRRSGRLKTAVSDNLEVQIQAIPNLVQDETTLTIESNSNEELELELFDLDGRSLADLGKITCDAQTPATKTISFSNLQLPSGVYIAVIQKEGRVLDVSKIVVLDR